MGKHKRQCTPTGASSVILTLEWRDLFSTRTGCLLPFIMSMPRDVADANEDTVILCDLPVIDTPITRLSEHWQTHQYGICADFEMDYSRCASRVGLKNVHKYCAEYFADWRECSQKAKTLKRYVLMQQERRKQGLPYEKPPPADSIRTLH